MDEVKNNKLLSNIEAHTNVLIRREQDINKKLVFTELLMSKYKIIQDLAVLLLKLNNEINARKEFVNCLAGPMNFQKILIIEINKEINIIDVYGYTSEDKSEFELNKESFRVLDSIFEGKVGEYLGEFVENNVDIIKVCKINTTLIGRAIYQHKKLYIICGYDNQDGEFYKAKYPISKDDLSWFMQLVTLWSSFVIRVSLFTQIQNKAIENQKLAEEREKQVEERTRSLLDTLFDAKKYKLALELADVIVMLVDVSSRKIIYANELFEKISGYGRDKIIGRKNLDILNIVALSNAPEIFSDNFYRDLKEYKAVRGNYILKTYDDSEKQIYFSISRFDEEEGGSIYVIIGRDITNERSLIKKEKEYAENIEKLNRLIINRELKIIELKKKLAKSI